MKILAVETATTWQSVAILEDDRILAMHEQEAGGAQGSLLLPTIDRLFSQSGLRLGDLSGLACSIGPGSFTGIRVGIATCLGLRGATGLPLTLVPTLEAMARNVDAATVPVCPMLVSRRGEVYWAIFRWTGDGRFDRVVSEQVGPPGALAQSLTEPTLVFGAGWSSLGQFEIQTSPCRGSHILPIRPPTPTSQPRGNFGFNPLPASRNR